MPELFVIWQVCFISFKRLLVVVFTLEIRTLYIGNPNVNSGVVDAAAGTGHFLASENHSIISAARALSSWLVMAYSYNAG